MSEEDGKKMAWRLGSKRMSASGIVENMVRQHLNVYGDELKEWYKLTISTESVTAHNGSDTVGGTNVWILRMECGEVMFSASRKRPRPHSRCGGNPLPIGRRFCGYSH